MTSSDELDFVQVAHTVLTIDKVAPVKLVAETIGMTPDSLYARLNRRVKFSPEEIRALIRAVPDVRLVNFFLDGSAFLAADRVAGAEGGGRTHSEVQHTANRSVIEVAHVLEEVDRSLADSKLDHQDRARILREIDETERALATLRTHLKPTTGKDI